MARSRRAQSKEALVDMFSLLACRCTMFEKWKSPILQDCEGRKGATFIFKSRVQFCTYVFLGKVKMRHIFGIFKHCVRYSLSVVTFLLSKNDFDPLFALTILISTPKLSSYFLHSIANFRFFDRHIGMKIDWNCLFAFRILKIGRSFRKIWIKVPDFHTLN